MTAAAFAALTHVLPGQDLPHPLSRSGTWDFAVWAGAATGREDSRSFTDAQIVTAGVRIGKVLTSPYGSGFLRGTLEYAFDVIPVFVTASPRVVYGGGFDPVVLKWNLMGTRRLQPFFEAAGGGVFTTSNVPPGDTSTFNFIAKIGAGVNVLAGKRNAVSFSLRYWHLSNADLGNTNPAFNGLQLAVGYHWFR